MASGERRGNREAKKPKQEKPKNPVPVSPFARKDNAPASPGSGADSRKR